MKRDRKAGGLQTTCRILIFSLVSFGLGVNLHLNVGGGGGGGQGLEQPLTTTPTRQQASCSHAVLNVSTVTNTARESHRPSAIERESRQPSDLSKPTVDLSQLDRANSISSTSDRNASLPGVAVTITVSKPRNPSNFMALLHNVEANLPSNWRIQIFHTPTALKGLRGVARLVSQGRVVLSPVPESHKGLDRKALLLSPWLWEHVLAEKVLVFDTPVALCGNAPRTIGDFLHWDWIGAAWKWAKPGRYIHSIISLSISLPACLPACQPACLHAASCRPFPRHRLVIIPHTPHACLPLLRDSTGC